MKPLISIVMSTYNENEKELKEAIESMLNQTYDNFEYIIILDNPENVEHIKIINEYCKKDRRISFIINKKNIGLALTLNKGIKYSKGKYIARMDADDISEKRRLEIQLNYMENNKDIDIISTNKVDINENNDIINIASSLPTEDKKIKKILEITSIITHSGAFFKKESIEKIGGYRNFPASQDYDLWLRASYYGLKFSIIDEPLLRYRIRNNNITNKNPLKQHCIRDYIKIEYKMLKKNGYDNFTPENLQKYLEKNKVYDDRNILKYKKQLKYIDDLKNAIKNRNILKIIKELFRILFSSKRVKCILKDYIIVHFLK